jgi:hypothetical protein
MENQYHGGDVVRVYDGPYWRSQAEHVGDAPESASRPATIVREMPYEPGDYEVEFTDGAEPASAYVTAHVLMLVSDVEAAKAARAERAMKAAAALVVEAQKLAQSGLE